MKVNFFAVAEIDVYSSDVASRNPVCSVAEADLIFHGDDLGERGAGAAWVQENVEGNAH